MKRALLSALLLAGLTLPAAAQYYDPDYRVIERRGPDVTIEFGPRAGLPDNRRAAPLPRHRERDVAPRYHDEDPRYGRRGRYERDVTPRYYDEEPRYGRRGGYGRDEDDFFDDGFRRRGPREEPRRTQRAAAAICVTSRGNCDAGLLSRGAPCRCMIPGFGEKRGQVVHR